MLRMNDIPNGGPGKAHVERDERVPREQRRREDGKLRARRRLRTDRASPADAGLPAVEEEQERNIRRLLAKLSGFSRAQLTQLIARCLRTRRVVHKPARRPGFPARHTEQDVALLASVDAAHEDLSGPAVRHILQREFQAYGNPAHRPLAGISASHIYSLCASAGYRRIGVRVEHTQARRVSLGEQRRPDPKGKPGYLRAGHGAAGAL